MPRLDDSLAPLYVRGQRILHIYLHRITPGIVKPVQAQFIVDDYQSACRQMIMCLQQIANKQKTTPHSISLTCLG